MSTARKLREPAHTTSCSLSGDALDGAQHVAGQRQALAQATGLRGGSKSTYCTHTCTCTKKSCLQKLLCVETIRSDIIILYILYLYSLHEVGKGLACLEPLAVGHLGVIKP